MVVTVIALALSASALLGDSAGAANGNGDDKVVVKPPEGTGKPPPGTGMGTRPRSTTRAATPTSGTAPTGAGPRRASGPVPRACARSPKARTTAAPPSTRRHRRQDHRGRRPAERRARQAQEATAPPRRRGDQTIGSWADMTHDYLAAYLPFYETVGPRPRRDPVPVDRHRRGGAARRRRPRSSREKPFAVINFDTYGLDTLVTSWRRRRRWCTATRRHPRRPSRRPRTDGAATTPTPLR